LHAPFSGNQTALDREITQTNPDNFGPGMLLGSAYKEWRGKYVLNHGETVKADNAALIHPPRVGSRNRG